MTYAILSAAASPAVTSAIDSSIKGVQSVAELLEKYGPFIVILAVFIVVFLGVLAYVIHNNQKMNKQIMDAQKKSAENNQQIMNDMIKSFIDMAKEQKEEREREVEAEQKHKKIVSAYIDSSLAFKDASRIAMAKIRCERVAIYLFHNGNSTPYGYSFAKMSCVHEWTMRGSDTIRGRTHVNIPLYAFSTIVEALVKDSEMAIGNIYEHGILSADEQVFQFISGSTTRALFALAIKDRDDDELVAFTVAEFTEPQDFSSKEVYSSVKDALQTMNDNIYSIVVNDEYRDSFKENSGEG